MIGEPSFNQYSNDNEIKNDQKPELEELSEIDSTDPDQPHNLDPKLEMADKLKEVQVKIDQLVEKAIDKWSEESIIQQKRGSKVLRLFLYPTLNISNDDGFEVPRHSFYGLIDEAITFDLAEGVYNLATKDPSIKTPFISAFTSYSFLKRINNEAMPDLSKEQREIVLDYLRNYAEFMLNNNQDEFYKSVKDLESVIDYFPAEVSSYLSEFSARFKYMIKQNCDSAEKTASRLGINSPYAGLANGTLLTYPLEFKDIKEGYPQRSENDETSTDRAARLYNTDEFKQRMQEKLESLGAKTK